MNAIRRYLSIGLLATCVLLGVTPAQAQTFTPVRVNAGGPEYTDTSGNVWAADFGYGPASYVASTGSPISGTADSALFQTLRYAMPPELGYSFPMPNGVYQVRLLFAEVWSGAFTVGARTFSVKAEDATVLPHVDVFAEAGPNAALEKVFLVEVKDNRLNLGLVPKAQLPIVNGIEVLSTDLPSSPGAVSATGVSTTQVALTWAASNDNLGIAAYEVERCRQFDCTTFELIATAFETRYEDNGLDPATTYRYRVRAIDAEGNFGPYSSIATATTPSDVANTPLLRVNAGGGAYTDSAGNSWSADAGYNTGTATIVPQGIAGTNDSSLYQSLRWQGFTNPELEYIFDVADGEYEVRLHFAEIYGGAAYVGGRVFTVQLEGEAAIPNLDVYAEAGFNTALVKTATTTVSDGKLNIRFVHGPTQHPMVSAIEVTRLTVDTPPEEPPPEEPVPGPAVLTAVATSHAQVDLSWTAATDLDEVRGYLIERCAGEECTDFADYGIAWDLAFTDFGVAATTTYRYRVRAYGRLERVGGYSNVAAATTPEAPSPEVEPPEMPPPEPIDPDPIETDPTTPDP